MSKIANRAKELLPDWIKIRRHLHQYPELSFQEEKTADFVAQRLEVIGIPFTRGWAGHGIVAMIEGSAKDSERVIALRADLDALPIQEVSSKEYASKNKGVMHACGHDVHTTCLLGAAQLLQENRSSFGGKIMLIFQPGEEKLPGGASIMIKEGLFDENRPTAIFGLHVHPPLEVGKVGLKSGLYMASADEIYIEIIGKGGHGALPQGCIDPIVISAKVIMALQEIVSRRADPSVPSVLTIGKINSDGGTTNVIPNSVKMEGTFRTMDEGWRRKAHELIKQTIEGICEASGGRAVVDLRVGYPCLVNDLGVSTQAHQVMKDILGEENVVNLPIRMTSEDFAFYSHEIPACFFRLGTGNQQSGITSPVHTNTFDVDEQSIAVGATIMASLALDALQSH